MLLLKNLKLTHALAIISECQFRDLCDYKELFLVIPNYLQSIKFD